MYDSPHGYRAGSSLSLLDNMWTADFNLCNTFTHCFDPDHRLYEVSLGNAMPETKDERPSNLKWLSDELSARSKSLIVSDGVPHFFWILDRASGECGYFGNIAKSDACRIVEILARQHGSSVLDSVYDKLIGEGENLEFPTLVECPHNDEYVVSKEPKKKVS